MRSQTVRNEISRVARAVKCDFLHWLSMFSVFYRQCRWGASARRREESAATFSSWPGNVQSAAPEAESALKLWSCTGTFQTGNATPGRAQRDTRHLPGEDGVETPFWSLTLELQFHSSKCRNFQWQESEETFGSKICDLRPASTGVSGEDLRCLT